jgi:D-xylose transport system ATP-binding protein
MLDVLQVADQIAVMYLGRMAQRVRRADINQQQLVELITTGQLSGRGVDPAATNGVSA